MGKMKSVFAEVLVSSQSSAEREGQGVGEKTHTHTQYLVASSCSFYLFTGQQTMKGVARENITAPYGIHAMRINTHTKPYVIHCHLSKSMQGRNPFQLGSRCSALHVDVDESIQKSHC